MNLPKEWECRPGPGGMGIRWKGRTLTSSYSPEEDARRRALGTQAAELFVTLGWGSGHFPRALAGVHPGSVVVAWEPHSGRVAASRAYPGWNTQAERVVFWEGSEPPLPHLRGFSAYATKIIVHPGLEEEPEILETQRHLEHLLDRLAVNERTLLRFAPLWGRNTQKNLLQPNVENLESWRGWAKGRTALLVAAGPSLERSLGQLAKIMEKNQHGLVLIGVDTAWEALASRGVAPHFLVSMDAQYWNSRHLDRPLPSTTVLVTDLVGHPTLLRKHSGRTALAGSSIPMVRDREGGQLPKLHSGGSVATAAASLAGFLGVQRLIWLGLDLCYTSVFTHVRPALVHRLRERTHHRLKTMLTLASEQLWTQALVQARTHDGRILQADQRMPLYASWISDAHQQGLLPSGIRVGRGWPIPGLETVQNLDDIVFDVMPPLPRPPTRLRFTPRSVPGNWQTLKDPNNVKLPYGFQATWEEWLEPVARRCQIWPCKEAQVEYSKRWAAVAAFFEIEGDGA